jgi:hypothetical protein
MRNLSGIAACLLIFARTAVPAEEWNYLEQIKPVLAEHCYECHGANHQKGGLRVDTAAFLRMGGDSGPTFRPGSSRSSLLLEVLEGTHSEVERMPLKREPLPESFVELLRSWIDQGGSAPAEEIPDTAGKVRSRHWAFNPPQEPVPPEVKAADWPRNPIDYFVLARLEAENVRPSPEADKATLIRRLSLDLTGLPPTLSEVEAFVRDPAPDAYERLVNRLLDSPHYGERWGRHWLDAARYADSNGYSIDAPRSIWPYRDWVIDAFNRDVPFDQFTMEQLAGDLLPNATLEQKIATGFHRNTQINQEGGIDVEQFRIESIFDRVDVTSTVFLGLTMACAQCHDHKFDPLSQVEYYQMFAFLNNDDEPNLEMATAEQLAARGEIQKRIKALESDLEDFREQEEEHRQRKAEIARLKKESPRFDTTMVLRARAEPRESRLFIKGDFTRPGDPVIPGVPKVLHPLPEVENPSRLDLARWVVDEENPLTARVTMNRFWQHYFGKGLVETENDFGTQGILPSHPELLDWLAREFVRQNWSMKAMHRLIVASATYRQASLARPDLTLIDPNNKMLARQSRMRLDAEIIRDVALVASGLFENQIGGPSVFPPQPDGVMNLGQSRRPWKASTGADRFRRGLYTFFWRATPHPMLKVFDAPDGFSTCTRRIRSNTPLQALTLLNDEAFFEFARGMARRVLDQDLENDEARLQLAFRLCLSRAPAPDEIARLQEFLAEQLADFRSAPEEALELGSSNGSHAPAEMAAWTMVSRVLLNLDETITRE